MSEDYDELLEWLRSCERDQLANASDCRSDYVASQLGLAIELISGLTAKPIPLAERKPGPGDCDGEGRVWVSYKPPKSQATIFWELVPMDQAMQWAPVDYWLPATALPLPA